jgi:hypothetical protein
VRQTTRVTHPQVTAILRCYGRPRRTERMLRCIQEQDFTGRIELLMMGDACPVFRQIEHSAWFASWANEFRSKGHSLFALNQAIHGGHWGYRLSNFGIKLAKGRYTIFLDNDDQILPEHVRFYYESIAAYPLDFVYNPTLVHNGGNVWQRTPELRHGGIGHQELIIRSEFLKTMPPELPTYDHDWRLVENMLAAGARHQAGRPQFVTHYIMSQPGKIEAGYEQDN